MHVYRHIMQCIHRKKSYKDKIIRYKQKIKSLCRGYDRGNIRKSKDVHNLCKIS